MPVLPGIPVPGPDSGCGGGGGVGGSGGSWLACWPRWILSAAGGGAAGCVSASGGSCRLDGRGREGRTGAIVEAVEVGGWLLAPSDTLAARRLDKNSLSCRLALAPSNGVGPSSWPGLRHYCCPASLRRQLRWLRPQRRGKEDRTGAIVGAVEVLAVLPGILVPGPDSGRGGGGGRRGCWLASGQRCRLAPAPSHPAGSLSDTITARPAPGGLRVGLAATSTAGERLAVQGLSWRRWRCWPSALESSFLG